MGGCLINTQYTELNAKLAIKSTIQHQRIGLTEIVDAVATDRYLVHLLSDDDPTMGWKHSYMNGEILSSLVVP